MKEINQIELSTNLCFFKSAWKAKNCLQSSGYIGISENRFDLNSVVAGIAKALIKQYIDALNILDSNYKITKVIICGAIARKSKFMIKAFKILDKKRNYILSNTKFDDTIEGLIRIFNIFYSKNFTINN